MVAQTRPPFSEVPPAEDKHAAQCPCVSCTDQNLNDVARRVLLAGGKFVVPSPPKKYKTRKGGR